MGKDIDLANRMTKKHYLLLMIILATVLFSGCQEGFVETPLSEPTTVQPAVWSNCHNIKFNIALPDTYIAAFTTKNDVEIVASWLDENGYHGDNFKGWVENANASGLVYYALDTKYDPRLTFADLTVACGTISHQYSLESYEEWILSLLTSGETVVDQQSFAINGIDVRRIIYDLDLRATSVRDDVFILNVEGQYWKFEFHSPVSEYHDRENAYLEALSTLSFMK